MKELLKRTLISASEEIEKSKEKNRLPDLKWILQLVQLGSSLGGARPKANNLDENSNLCVAKFPSRKDAYDMAIWGGPTNKLSVFGRLYIIVHSIYLLSYCYIHV